MRRAFQLSGVSHKNAAGFNSGPTPSAGEDVGNVLYKLAEDTRAAQSENKWDGWKWTVIQLYLLASDAYEAGASASIGHNRTARYRQAAELCRKNAEMLGWEGPHAV